ncbi:hypothetical protein GNY06_01850 [Elizabethkingia argentiflava]|uniref:DUF4258 domain-containing protein n=1 Tax=Elizabethkingia argenteiflava TaxID=2681556 RepID=A0A845PPV5_9FLAO|nr:hypothetical protein [Elizabethkingia argenteiflava]NAW50182.1 hypothetical protein [Elizabethkingia argenteiflava]
MRRFRFYLTGLIPGILFVFFILNQKESGCSYFPNERVIAETLTKDFILTDDFKKELEALHLSPIFLKDSIITKGNIDFKRSAAQQQPCPQYLLIYPAKHPIYEIEYEKCKEMARFISLKKIK